VSRSKARSRSRRRRPRNRRRRRGRRSRGHSRSGSRNRRRRRFRGNGGVLGDYRESPSIFPAWGKSGLARSGSRAGGGGSWRRRGYPRRRPVGWEDLTVRIYTAVYI